MPEKKRIIRLPEVIARTGRSRSSIYADMKCNAFPKPINLGARAVGWLEADVDAWIEGRIQKSRNA